MHFLKRIKDEDIKDIDDLWEIQKCFLNGGWIFRGQKKTKEDDDMLTTQLDKAMKAFKIPQEKTPDIEEALLRKFQRHSAIYLKDSPVSYNYMEWFALMQHYGAPTRLQDWTYSFFVAVYLAVNDMKEDAEVWAINTDYIEKNAIERIKKKDKFKKISKKKILDMIRNDSCAVIPEYFEDIFMKEPKPFVLPMNPRNLNERLIIQQGVFLCPGDISKKFLCNLDACFPEPSSVNKNIRRFKIHNEDTKKDILMLLQRMNMNNATLFPGLSGFSESLRTLLAFPLKEDGGMLARPPKLVKDYLSKIIKVKL
jgi:hypothetical protein